MFSMLLYADIFIFFQLPTIYSKSAGSELQNQEPNTESTYYPIDLTH